MNLRTKLAAVVGGAQEKGNKGKSGHSRKRGPVNICMKLAAVAGAAVLALPVFGGAADAAPQTGALKNVNFNTCLNNDANRTVTHTSCNGSNNQKWTFDTDTSGTTIKNLATGLCLTNGTTGEVGSAVCTDNAPKYWSYSKVTAGSQVRLLIKSANLPSGSRTLTANDGGSLSTITSASFADPKVQWVVS